MLTLRNAANANLLGLPLIHSLDEHFFSVGLIIMMCALRKPPLRVIHTRAPARAQK